MKAIILSVALSVASAQNPLCKSTVFDECHYPPLFTAVHSETIEQCAETCAIYNGINSCDYYSYSSIQAIDENCELYAFDETLPEFQSGCNKVGVPSGTNCVFFEDTCTVVEPCKFCTACGGDFCTGYMETECDVKGTTLELFDAPLLETCQALCKVQGGVFLYWYREEGKCECYLDVTKTCNKQIVKYDSLMDLAQCKA